MEVATLLWGEGWRGMGAAILFVAVGALFSLNSCTVPNLSPPSLGSKGPGGKVEITYGPLFVETANTFEALSGTLKTAKKYKVRFATTSETVLTPHHALF